MKHIYSSIHITLELIFKNLLFMPDPEPEPVHSHEMKKITITFNYVNFYKEAIKQQDVYC